MSRRLGKGGGAAKPAVRFDDNVASYDVSRDGRSAEGRVQQIPLDRIENSPFQVRRIFPEAQIEALAESIRDNGLIHEPRGRPHPTKPGWVELMPGEMRLRALRRLIEIGEAESVLMRDSAGQWLVPIRVDEVDDERAEAIVFSENLDRTDLSAWEWVLAWKQSRDILLRRGKPATVRGVAKESEKKYQTVGEYLSVADAITGEILESAGLVVNGSVAHTRMGKLALAALKRVAKAAADGTTAAAEALLVELRRVGDKEAAAEIRRRKRHIEVAGRTGFQLNIRQALDQVPAPQAAKYLKRLAPVVDVLAGRAASTLSAAEAKALATALTEAASRLKRGA